jgi:hypothetical protein
VPRLCEFYLGICLKTEERARKNLSHGKKNLRLRKISVRAQDTYYQKKTSVRIQYTYYQKTPQSEYSIHVTEESWCDSFFSFSGSRYRFGGLYSLLFNLVPGVLWVSNQVENEWSFTSAFPRLVAYVGTVSPLY